MSSRKLTSSNTVNVHEAKTHFSKLLARVVGGEEILVAKAGKPVARLVPFAPPGRRRPPGWENAIVPDSVFFDPLPEDELRLWEGRSSKE